MTNIQEQILAEFYRRLAKTDGFTEPLVQDLRELFSGVKKAKVADVVKAVSKPQDEKLP